MTQQPTSPRTAAGRALLGTAYLAGDAKSEGVDFAAAILAIEAEAVAEPTALLRALVDGLGNATITWSAPVGDGPMAVLAAREYLRQREEG